MPEVLTIPDSVTQWPEPPRFWWNGPRAGKNSSPPLAPLSPALQSTAGEAPIGSSPTARMLAAWLLECLLFLAIVVLPGRS